IGPTFDAAIPICSSAVFDGKRSRLDHRSWWWLSIVGRLKPGVTPQQANARLAVLSPSVAAAALPTNWEPEYQQRFRKTLLVTSPAATGESYLRRSFAQPLNILMAIVALVLLIACANIASLLLARATTRSREIAIRNALGASRGRLIRQLLTESLLLSAVGAAAGLLFARWASTLLVRSMATGHRAVFMDLSLDGLVLEFTAGVAVLTGILVGLLPAWRSTRVSLMAAMKGSQSAEEERHSRFRAGKWIVSSQIAVSLLLLISGGLLLRSFVKMLTVDLGFDRNNVLVMSADLRAAQLPPEQHNTEYDAIAERLRAVPGVVSVARSFTTPLSNYAWNNNILVDSPNPPTGDAALAWMNAVTPDYFATLRTPLLAGREFNAQDTKDSPPVAIVTQTLAEKFFPPGKALGGHFRMKTDPGEPQPLIEIVGIVKDSRYESIREEAQPVVFFPATQSKEAAGTFELRTAVPPSAVIPAVERAVASVSKGIPLQFETLSQQVSDSVVQERLLATLSAFFGALALLLAMIGLYGVLSYLVTHRQTEFGIRMALGARPASILQLVLRDVAVVVAAGVAGGLAISLAVVTLLRKMLFGLAPRDALTMALAVVVLTAVALLAGFLPARRAARVDPMVALRYE
ncbi:MAG TPA: ADOP family duplicated permease, partial [Terriglobales bacterium]|nr:ADOP family duplicated permease [Terriglobales bacterium]